MRTDQRGANPLALAVALLIAGAALSGALAYWQTARNAERAVETLDAAAARTVEQVQRRLAIYEYGLRGARGAVVSAGIDQINREKFRDYSESRDLDREFPGARGMGMIRRISVADEQRFLEAARADGSPDFSIHSLSPQLGERYIIQYIEPIERNRTAIGLDIASEVNRRTAAERSMRTGEATLTAPITLLQATRKPLRSFLLLLPIYAPGSERATAEARIASTFGWSYAPLVIDEVLADLHLGDELVLELRDTEAADGGVFFETEGSAPIATLELRRTLSLPIYGRTWQATLRATPSFVSSLNLTTPGEVGGVGLGIALLVSILSFNYAQSAQRKAQVQSEQARRAAIVDSTNDAIIAESADGIVLEWNHGAELLFGYSAKQALGKTVTELILPAERLGDDDDIRSAIARGELVSGFDTRRKRADGAVIDVSITAAPIQDDAGRRIGLSKTIRDITAAKRAEREIAELNSSLERQVIERTALLDAAQRDLRNILDAVPSLVSYWDRDLRNRFANRAYEEWLGWDPAQMPGRHLSDVAGDAFGRRLPRFEAALRGEAGTYDTTVESPDGSTRHAVVHFIPDIVDAEVRGFYVIAYDVTAQTNARAALAAALRENEALLRTVHEHAIVSVTDHSGRIVDVNERFCASSGYTREELIGQDHRLLSSGVHSASFWADVWRTIAAGEPWRGEVCNRKKDGSLYWVDSMLAPFRGADGTIEKYIAIRIDITAAKENELKLQLNKDRIAMATDAAGIGIWEWDIVANTLTWDDWMYRLYGHSPASNERTYELWSKHLHPDDRARAERERDAALNGQRAFDTEFRIVRSDGEVRHLRASARVVRDVDGKPLRMTGVNFDITERKRAELNLIETSSLLSSVLESASEVAIIAGDPQLTIKVFNVGAERLLGYSAAEVVDQVTPMLFHDPQEVVVRAAELTQLAGEPVIGAAAFVHPLALRQPKDWTYVRKDGQRITVSLVVTAMYGKNGELFGYLGVAHDVTKQKEYETSLRTAMHEAEQAKRATSRFLANMSHEIRTPMNAVVGLSYLLGQTKLDVEQDTFLGKINVASRSLMALIDDVLDLSKIEAGEFSLEQAPFNLAALLADVSDLASAQAHAKKVAFYKDFEPGLHQALQGDVTRLAQILNNLVSNAVKFTHSGSVTLRALTTTTTGDTINLRFEVEDTGIGIADSVQARLFSPFTQADASTTRRFGGTGLGLSIVKHLVELMGGQVGLRSELGLGSTFWVSLSLQSTSAPLPLPHVEHQVFTRERLRGVRILIADDSEINLLVASRTLGGEGAIVSVANNGQQTIERLRQEPNAIDIVLMDVHMPVMDGYGALLAIRQELGLTSLPIVALTADARSSERQRALASGMNDFLVKPLVPKDLVNCIRRLVRPGAPGASSQSLQIAAAQPQWPQLPGIESSLAQAGTLSDLGLFQSLLAYLLDEFVDVTLPSDWSDATARAAYADQMHKLRGSAGQIGAKSIQTLATRLEEHAKSNEPEAPIATSQELVAQLNRLRAGAAPLRLGERPPVQSAALEPTAVDGGQLRPICDLLRQQDLAVLSRLPAIYPWVSQSLGNDGFELFMRHIEGLRFAEAVALIEPWVDAAQG